MLSGGSPAHRTGHRIVAAAARWPCRLVTSPTHTSGCWSRTFPGRAGQVREARAFLADLLAGNSAAEDAALCLSELATNAVQHSRSGEPGGRFTVQVALARSGHLLVTVDDDGGPWLRRPDPGLAGGRGLFIVGELAAAAGVLGDDTGRTAWFA
jgi:serine/threonine-protein kinase RsbW